MVEQDHPPSSSHGPTIKNRARTCNMAIYFNFQQSIPEMKDIKYNMKLKGNFFL